MKLLIGGSPCFVAGTMVKTEMGFKPIEQIGVGEKVLTHKGHYRAVKEVMSRQVDETVIVKAENCGEIECTKEHPFYTRLLSTVWDNERRKYYKKISDDFSWIDPLHFSKLRKKCGDISEQTYLTSVTDKETCYVNYNGVDIKQNQYVNKHICKLDLTSGYLWYVIGRWVGDGWFNYKYKKTGKRLSGIKICCGKQDTQELKKHLTLAKLNYIESSERTVVKFTISNLELALFLKNFGEGAKNKFLPQEVFVLPNELARSFLGGYLDSDGYIKENRGSFTTISKELAYGIKYMINKYYKSPCTISHNPNHSNIIEGRIVKTNDLYTGTFCLERKRQSHYLVDDNYIMAPYIKVEQNIGRKMVYNLSVEEDESYTANGLVVHNCTHWSIAQTKNRETTAEGIGWELFKNYVIARDKYQPDYFLYENNKSMSSAIRQQITAELGVEPVLINSALVSAQNRQRLYWVGKRNADGKYEQIFVEQPQDKGLVLKDILDNNAEAWQEKSYCLTTRCMGAIPENTIKRKQHTMVAQPLYLAQRGRYVENGSTEQHFEVQSSGKTNTLTTVQKDNLVAEPLNPLVSARPTKILQPVRIGTIENNAKNKAHDSKQYRVYSPETKSVTLCGSTGGLGVNTGLYATPCVMRYERSKKGKELRKQYETHEVKHGYHEFSELHPRPDGKSNTLSTVLKDNPVCERLEESKNRKIFYQVRNGFITIKDKQYPIKLADGYYIIRKLTVNECKRLQTVPDWYGFPVSKSQAYKMLGNGWTVDVISHIMSHFDGLQEQSVEVLSMYDGMSCGRIALENLGVTPTAYYATEIDKHAIKTTQHNFPDTIQLGDAFQIRNEDWRL